MSMYMTDTFCSFMRNVIFKSCFLFSEYGSTELTGQVNGLGNYGTNDH